MKNRTILRMFTIPLLLVTLIQTLIVGGYILFGNSMTMLSDYSVSILDQTVKTRKVIIENSMIQNWSNVSETVDQVNLTLQKKLQSKNITVEAFLQDDPLQNELLQEMLSSCLYVMRKNVVTGSFIILGNPDGLHTDYDLNGVYFRDMDPYTNSATYSDILMERGDSAFSRELNIPFDLYWKSKFNFLNRGEREADDFFYQPLYAAREYPDARYMDLGYWSKAFCLENNSERDAYQMITYSVPLVYEDGTVYGVFGVEISLRHLIDMLPSEEISEDNYNGYMMGQYEADGNLLPIAYTGTIAARTVIENDSIHLENMDYPDLYLVDGARRNDDMAVVAMQQLHLYNSNTPFEDEIWVICGVREYNSLFGFGQDILLNFSVTLIVALVIAVISVMMLVRRLTRPIMDLSESIRLDSRKKLEEFSRSNIVEVDELYDVVLHLTKTQEENAFRLTEEKERYKAVLQSSTDVLFTCDYQRNTLELINMITNEDRLDEIVIEDLDKWLLEGDMIHPDYRVSTLEMFRNTTENVVCEIKARIADTDPYTWVFLQGKVVYDPNGNPSKLIGSIRDIDEQKEEELREQNLMRVDRVTGLFNKATGEQMINDRLLQGAAGCMVLLDMDNFFLLNETYGIIVGDTVLEEIGNLITEYCRNLQENNGLAAVGVRVGGDEILLWLEGISSHQVKEDMSNLQKTIVEWYAGSGLVLAISGGIAQKDSQEMDYSTLLLQIENALTYAKTESGEKFVIYDSQLEAQFGKIRSINDIASVSYQNELSIVSLVFNFFDKGGKMSNILPILFRKLGRHFQANAIVMTTVDRDFRTTYADYRWEKETGTLPSETIFHFAEKDFTRLIRWIEGCPKEGITLEALKKEEEKFLMVGHVSSGISVPIYDAGNYIGSLTFVKGEAAPEWNVVHKNDIQEIAKIIEANFSKEKHDMASRAKSEFLSRMSHEMRTPMNAIIGMTAIAQTQKNDPEKVEGSLGKIEQSSKYLLSLINDVLDMSKIESGKMKLLNDQFNLRQALTDIRQLVLPQAQEKELELITDITLTCDWVVGDMLHLQQVLVNLLGNAVKFTPKGGAVTFTVKQSDLTQDTTEIFFSVRDTGIGVSENSQKKIFHSFEQADDQVSGHFGGTGLGLAISGNLVNMMGGVIEVKSELGKGSDFYFRIVLEKGKEVPVQADIQEIRSDSELVGKKILLVDDNELNIEIAQTLLEMKGFVIETANDGKEAVEKYQENEAYYYDMILMDIRMPVMNGLEATREIRQLTKEDASVIPIVAMTANAFDEDMKKSIDSGMNGHLSKPIDVKALLDMMKRVIR